MTPRDQLCVLGILLSTGVSLVLLLTMFLMAPRGFGWLWGFLMLCQIASGWSVYHLSKKGLDLPKIHRYLRETDF